MTFTSAQNILSRLKLDRASPEDLHLQLQRKIRDSIQSQQLKPGQKLPTNFEISASLNVSYEVVQRAMKALADRGVVARRKSKGTFVKEAVVSKVVGIFCTESVFDPKSSPCMYLLAHHLTQILQGHNRDAQFYCVPLPTLKINKIHYDLLRDLEEHRLAGLIWLKYAPQHHKDLLDTALRAGVATVGMWIREAMPHTVWIDMMDFCRKGIRRLLEEGCRRIALIGFSTDVEAFSTKALLAAAREEGADLTAEDVITPPADRPMAARGENAARDFDLGRYDGAVLADDIMAVGFTRGLRRRNARVPEDLRLVTYWNRGNPLALALPATRYEMDMQAWARRSIRMLDDVIEGNPIHHPHVYLKVEDPAEPAGCYRPAWEEGGDVATEARKPAIRPISKWPVPGV